MGKKELHCCTIRRSYRCDQCQLSRCCQRVKDSQVFDTIYGSVNGILGILNNNVINLSEIVANEETLNRLKTHTVYVFRFLPLQTSYRGRIT